MSYTSEEAPPGPASFSPKDEEQMERGYLGKGSGGPMPYELDKQHQAIEKNMSSLLGMTAILLILIIVLLLAFMSSSRKNFKNYCQPLKKQRYGTPKWKDGRWIYE